MPSERYFVGLAAASLQQLAAEGLHMYGSVTVKIHLVSQLCLLLVAGHTHSCVNRLLHLSISNPRFATNSVEFCQRHGRQSEKDCVFPLTSNSIF